MKKIILYSIVLIISGCDKKYDKNKFNIKEFISDHKDEILEEYKNEGIDTAYLQFVGFAKKENIEDYKSNPTISYDLIINIPDLRKIDLSMPIFLVNMSCLRHFEGNGYRDAGITLDDLDRELNSDLNTANYIYSGKDYKYDEVFYNCAIATIVDGKFIILNEIESKYFRILLKMDYDIILWNKFIKNKPLKNEYEKIFADLNGLQVETWMKGSQDFETQISNETELSNWVKKCIVNPLETKLNDSVRDTAASPVKADALMATP